VKYLRIVTLLLLIIQVNQLCIGQAPGVGLPMFGSLQSSDFDSIALQSLNVNFMIPVVGHPGRGRSFNFVLGYNSLFWVPSGGTSSKWSVSSHFGFGWVLDGPGGTLQYQRGESGLCIAGSAIENANYIFTDPAGTAHPFNVAHFDTNACNLQGASTGYATDGSGYYIDILTSNGPTVRSSAGDVFIFTSSQSLGTIFLQNPVINDANGNHITTTVNSQTGETGFVDTLGQTVLEITKQFNNPNSSLSEADYDRLAVDGTYQTIAVKYQVFNIKTNFGCSGIAEFTSPSGGGEDLVTEIDFPNGQKYLFSYEPTPGSTGYFTGRIQQVTLPTGGTINYQYNGANGGINCTDGTGTGLTRTVSDGVTNPVWVYSRVPGSQLAGITTVTAPQLPYDTVANQTVITFDSKGRETNRKVYQGAASGNPVNTVNTSWAASNTPASRIIVLEDGSTQSQIETTYDSSVNGGTGSNGNLLVLKEHDWGSGTPGPVLRTTTITYLADPAYVGLNIISKLKEKTVADSSGTIKFRVHINYDEPGFVNASCVTGALQHDDTNYGCSYTTRGLPTSLITYTDAVTPAGGSTQNISYDSVGNLIASRVNNVLQTQWNFSSVTQYAFPDSMISGPPTGPQLTNSFTYHLPTGQVAAATDANGKTTTYTYSDAGHLDRLTDVGRPDGIHITNSYDDVYRTVTVSTPVQGTSAVQKITAFDLLGRPTTNTIEDAANNVFSIVQTQYDPMGRPYKSSNPYITSPQFWTTNQFDTLGRPTVRLLPDGAQATSSYTTNAVLTTDPAGKQIRSFMDGLGRLIHVDEPGDAFAGTEASGSISISGTLGSKPAIPATSGRGNVAIKGTEQQTIVCTRTCTSHWDTGSVSITVNIPGNTITKTAFYGQGSTAQTLANSLASQFSSDPNFTNVNVVNTTGGDGISSYTVNLTASAVGGATNYSYSGSSTGTKNDFTATAAGSTFTGGADGQNAATDFGTITLTIGAFTTAPVCYGSSCNSTASAVASALATALGVQGSPVGQISVNGSTISMTANQPSASWNVAVTATPTSGDPADFPQGSFANQGSLSGGADPYPSGLAHPYSTFYSHGVLDNLLQVAQGVQNRTYAYDGMGRLTDVTTPEAGHVNFQYSSFSQVSQQTDARGVKTNYGFDTLNRLHTLSYDVGTTGVPATPAVTYNYGTDPTQNNNGRLLSVLDGLGSETYTYDMLGRTTQLQKVINGATYNIGYGYNLAGEVTSLTYPSGHVVQQSFDAIGRLCEIAPLTTGCATATAPYATGYTYNTAFEATGLNFGNGVNSTFGFSPDRLQMTSLNYIKGTQTLFGLNYFYQQDSTNCPTGAAANNGQIQCINDLVDSGRNAAYTYDTLGRLAGAFTQGSASYPLWNLAFTYDRYGNRTAQNSTTVTINPATNQISTLSYDASGNMLNDGINALAYDAAGRMVTSTQASAVSTYSYDCKNLRVQKVSGGNTTIYIFSGGKVLAEYLNGALPTAPTREYVYSGSGLLAKVEAGTTSYNLTDHLSTRMFTDANGASLGQQGHFPFGDPWYDTASNKWKFTTYERDSESQNDYAMARYYINRNGRFTSPDPLSGSVGNPQSLNRYAYGANDPINNSDPTGQFLVAFERRFQNMFLSYAAIAVGEGGGCLMDGIETSCQVVTRYIDNNLAHICPHNNCDPIFSAEHGWVMPVRTDPDNGEWQIWQVEFYYLDPSRATRGNPNGAGYRNGRWVPEDVSGDLPMGYYPSFMPGSCCYTGVFPEKQQKSIWAPLTPEEQERARAKMKDDFGYDVCQDIQTRKDLGQVELDLATGSAVFVPEYAAAVGYMGLYDKYANGVMAGSLAGCKLK
jgi:RHS repeat-associated protein